MTVEEAKVVYGESDNNYYVLCSKCPLDRTVRCLCENDGNCSGYNDTWERIAKHFTEKVLTEDVAEPTETDNVNHPSHYNNGGMECIDEMILIFGVEATKHFCLLNAWKYRYRANHKNGQEDLDKANWYIAKYKELSANE